MTTQVFQRQFRDEIHDQLTLASQAKHERLEAARGVDLCDMPEDRPGVDGHHWLWAKLCFLAKPRTFSTAEIEDLD